MAQKCAGVVKYQARRFQAMNAELKIENTSYLIDFSNHLNNQVGTCIA